MQGAGEQLLAGPRLAEQQHAGGGVGHPLQLGNGPQQLGGIADDAVASGVGMQGTGQHVVVLLQCPRLLLNVTVQMQHLPGQRREDTQDGQVVGQRPGTHADAVAGQHADGLLADLDRQGDEGHWPCRQLAALDHAAEEDRLLVDVLHYGHLAMRQHPAGNPLAQGIAPKRHLLPGQAVGIADAPATPILIEQHDPPAVQAQQFGEQVEHFLEHRLDREALAGQGHDLLQQEHFL
ncbi:hypothetical protein D3C84_727110 [compost metagenome]